MDFGYSSAAYGLGLVIGLVISIGLTVLMVFIFYLIIKNAIKNGINDSALGHYAKFMVNDQLNKNAQAQSNSPMYSNQQQTPPPAAKAD